MSVNSINVSDNSSSQLWVDLTPTPPGRDSPCQHSSKCRNPTQENVSAETLPGVDSCQVVKADNANDQGLYSRPAEASVQAHLTQHTSASEELQYTEHTHHK